MDNHKDLDLILEKAKKMQEDNPEEFEKKLEKVKEDYNKGKLEDRLRDMDDEKREKLREVLEKVDNIRKNNDKDERLKLYEEMKEKLSPKEQVKLQKLAKLLRGMMKNK